MTVKIEHLDQVRPLASLPDQARLALANAAREVTFSVDERLIPIGQPPQRLLILIDGLVKLVGVSANGHERILAVHRPGDLVGPGVLLDRHEHDYEANAMSPGRALSISRRDLLIVGRDHPSIIMTLAKEVSRLLAEMTDRMMTATSAEVPVRLSQLLLEFAHRMDDGGRRDGERQAGRLEDGVLVVGGNGNGGRPEAFVPLSYPLTHESMAQIVGASRPHTSTVLRDLEKLGAVQRKSRRGLLVAPGRLRQIVDAGDVDELDGIESGPRNRVAAAFEF